jgi:hypothetical protein
MKTLLSFVSASVLAVSSSFAQVPGIPGLSRAPVVSTGPQGTTLGANLTSGAGGIDLANRVKLRGFVDFWYENIDDEGSSHEKGFKTSADMDFLFDFSPVTAEIHTNLSQDLNGSSFAGGIEQAFIRYSFNRDFNISMGRQLTALGFESDEAPNLYQVSHAYLFGDIIGGDTGGKRRNYVDGIRANFNNGRFGFTIGLHNNVSTGQDNTNDGNVGVDLQGAFMIMPGFEARLGYAHDSDGVGSDDDIEQFNAWLSYTDRALTLAFEYDDWDVKGQDVWDIMLMGSYQFNNFFALTLRYSHEDEKDKRDNDRITIGTGFSITDNFGINLELSHAGVDEDNGGDYDVDEFYAEGIMTF